MRHRVARHALHRHYLAMLQDLVELPIVTLPYLPGSVTGPADLEALAPALLATPTHSGGPVA